MASCGELDVSTNNSSSSKLMEEDCCPSSSSSSSSSSSTSCPECAICLQSCVHPVRLPCCHVFCFLCVKGASWQGKRCALCRQQIPEDFLDRPVLLSPDELKAAAASGLSRGGGTSGESHGGGGGGGGGGEFCWYYEGRDGWWQYDERTSRELEDAFAKGRKSTEMLIAGFLYVADLENMVQYRRNEHGRRRKMKRDVVDIPKKGVAGLRLEPSERISSADGSDSLHPVRPHTLLGPRPSSPLAPPPSSLEESFSQLLIGEELDGEMEEEEPTEQRRLRVEQPTRIPPRGQTSSSALSLRSGSPDGQCTVTEV